MILFLNLYLAHMLGDFVLQFDELYRLKTQKTIGHFYHVIILAIVSIALTLPYAASPFIWIFILVIYAIHFVQDKIKYRLQDQGAPGFLCFTLDQIIHFLWLSLIFLFPLSKQPPPHSYPLFINLFYSDPVWVLGIIWFLWASFGGAYFLHSLRKTYIKNSRPDHFITRMEFLYGIFERSLTSAIFLLGRHPLIFFLSPAISLVRLFQPKLKNRLDFFLNFVYSAALGLLFRLWI